MNIFRKYNLIKKIFIPILVLAIFLMPVSPNLEIKNERLTVNTKTNTTSAEDYTNLFPGSSVKWLSGSSSTAEFEVNIVGNQNDWDKTEYMLVNSLLGLMSKNPNSTVLVVTENGNYVSSYDLSGEILMGSTKSWSLSGYSFSGPLTINGWRSVQNLQPGKSYAVDLYIQSDTGGDGGGINLFGSTRKNFYKFGKGDSFTTSAEGGLLNGENPTASRPEDKILSDGSFFACDRLMVGNALDLPCQLTKAMYYLVFVPISWIAGFAGQFMDFFVFYSTNSSSYKSNFVSDAWGAVRDIANIFFIIALLYIAIKTILSMGGHDSKKLIINIILIALIINFSLFVTQVVIDGSNILAKVFYNNIKVENQDESIAKKGDNGEKQISAGLVRTFNPQQVFDDAGIKKMTDNLSLFFLVLLLMSAISLYMIYMFISISLLFVARVVGLWLSMIFSPIAFASKTLPFEIPGLGFKKWLEDLFKQSFMAPIFIFFLYIVYLFSGFIASAVKDVSINTGQQPGLVPFMKVIIPMAILFGLLQQAKKLAVQFSGDLGQSVNKIGAVVGGAAVGVATGGAAVLGRATLGRAGAAMANSKWANKWATEGNWAQRKIGLAARDTGKAAAKGSFDLRGVKVAGKSLSSTGLKVNTLGGPNKGGFEKMREDKIEKRKRRAQELEVGKYEPLQKSLNESQVALQSLNKTYEAKIADINKKLDKARQNLRDSKDSNDKEGIENFGSQVKAFKAQMKALKTGKNLSESGQEIKYKDEKGVEQTIKDNYSTVHAGKDKDGNLRTMDFLEETEIKHKHHLIEEENRRRKWNYADKISSRSSKTWNKIVSLGQYSSKGADEAAYQIKMEVKAAPKAPKQSGGDHSSGSHGGGEKHEQAHNDHKGGGEKHEQAHNDHKGGGEKHEH